MPAKHWERYTCAINTLCVQQALVAPLRQGEHTGTPPHHPPYLVPQQPKDLLLTFPFCRRRN